MRSLIALSSFSLLLGVGLTPRAARAATSPSPTLVERRIAQDGLRERGSLARLGKRKIAVAGRKGVRVADIAAQVFQGQRALNKELQAASAALVGAPAIKEEVVRTASATVFVSSTTITIRDPALLRASSPRFKGYRAKANTAPRLLASKLSADQAKALQDFKATLAAQPSSHPLYGPMQQGDQALLDAIALGLGDLTITTRISMPTLGLTRVNASTLHVPTMVNGAFSYTSLIAAVLNPALPPIIFRLLPPVAGTGAAHQVAKFLTGFTLDRAFEWEESWDFGVGEFELGAHAWYAFGLRVPVEFTVDTTPTRVEVSGVNDRVEYTTVVDPRVFNAPASYYSDVGLPARQVYDGKEFVLTAGAYLSIRLEVLGGTLVNETLPNNLQIDHGKQFTPPFDGCGNACGVDWWIPASVTRTNISILGLVSGSAQIGFRVAGEGEPKIAYESIVDDAPVTSKKGSRAAVKHELSWTRDTTREFVTEFWAKDYGNDEQWPYGWRLSNPRFDWTVELTPGVKGTIDINAWPINETIVVGPYFLNAFTVNLGTLHLPTHSGTVPSVQMQPGLVTRK